MGTGGSGGLGSRLPTFFTIIMITTLDIISKSSVAQRLLSPVPNARVFR